MGLNQEVKPAKYAKLSELGNLYSRPEGKYKKLRVGIFESEEEAKEARQSIAKAGFKKAFVVNEVLDDPEGLEVHFKAEEEEEEIVEVESEPTVEPEIIDADKFLVRLAAYRNPEYFKATKVNELGAIEKRVNGKFTVMYISGFSSVKAAESARKKAISSGFRGAYLVENVDGELVKVVK